MKNILKISLLFSLFSIFAFAKNSENIGIIKSMKGAVVVTRAGERMVANEGFVLYRDDTIRTIKFSKATIEFSDGTIVNLGKASKLRVNDYIFDGEHSKVALNAQEGIFQVITGKIGKINPHRFNVRTSSITIGIRGTKFDIRNENGLIDIGCFKGKVVLIGKSGSSAALSAGEAVHLKHQVFNQDDVVKESHSFFTLEDLNTGYYLMRDVNSKQGVVGYAKKGSKVVSKFKIDELANVDFGDNSYLEIDKRRFEKLKFLSNK